MNKRRIIEILRHGQVDDLVTVQGWLRTKRTLKDFSFVEVNDGSSLANVQVVLDANLADYDRLLPQLNTGAAVVIEGQLVPSPGKGQRVELKATKLELLGGADPASYPLQKKRHSFEFLRTIGDLRPRTNTIGAVMRVRNACAAAIHQFFQEKGFLWVHTPIITASDCEGAGDLFNVTTLDLQRLPQDKKSGGIDYSQDFFGKQAYLTVSGQLEAEIMATAFQNVYTFGLLFEQKIPIPLDT